MPPISPDADPKSLSQIMQQFELHRSERVSTADNFANIIILNKVIIY